MFVIVEFVVPFLAVSFVGWAFISSVINWRRGGKFWPL